MGWSPEAFTIDWCRDHGIDLIPGDGYLPACVPAPVDTWATALARFGTMSFAEILQPTIEFAEQGFPVYASLSRHLHASRAQYAEQYPTTGAVYLPDGSAPNVGDVLRNPDFGAMLRIMCRAEEGAKGRGRVAGIEAARDAFYRGEIAERIARFIADHPVADSSGAVHAALLTYDDLAEWHARVEDPVTLNYRGLDVFKCSSWTQGPVFLQQLAILQGLDLKAMGHNSADYLHTWIETAKLAFADREAYYGDPDFDAVPFDVLLSAGYGERRAAQIGQTGFPGAASRRSGRRRAGVRGAQRARRQPAGPGSRAARQEPCWRRRCRRPARTGTCAAPGRHHPPRRGGRRGQHGGGHPERGLDRLVAGDRRGWAFRSARAARCSTSIRNAPTRCSRASGRGRLSRPPSSPGTAHRSWRSAPPAATARTNGRSSSS